MIWRSLAADVQACGRIALFGAALPLLGTWGCSGDGAANNPQGASDVAGLAGGAALPGGASSGPTMGSGAGPGAGGNPGGLPVGPAIPVTPDVVAGPGAVVAPEPLHRLNRLEYNNTVRDLIGASGGPADAFPPDPALDGFDNFAEGLTLSSALLGLYADTARELATSALNVQPRFLLHKLAKDVATGGHEVGSRGWSLYDPALKPPPGYGDVHDLKVAFELSQEEAVTVTITAGGTASKADTPVMGVQIDGLPKQTFTVSSPVSSPKDFTFEATLPAGSHELLVTFDNFHHRPPKDEVNSLILQDLDIRSATTAPPAARALIQTCDPLTAPDPKACYAEIVSTFARRAWRRALTVDETTRLVGLWEKLTQTEGEEAALELTLRAVLISPHFLYRTSKPLATVQPVAAEPVPLDDFSLASRLSYFVWASMPDDELLGAAAQGMLREQGSLSAQLQRMLADPKAAGLVDGFAAQWLNSRKLKNARPDARVFPGFDEPLRTAMQRETELFFGDFVTNGLPLTDLLTPDFGYLDDRLAKHYGMAAPGSTELVRVPRAAGDRGGLVMLGAWLTTQSGTDRTSPVLRGRWVTEQLMCLHVPPPPPVIEPAKEAPPDATIRERLAAHRADPQCAGCHNVLDPPGLGLEEFDAVGRIRDEEDGAPIDSSGGVPGGPDFVGGAALAEALKKDPRFYACVTDKIAAYALGRRLVKTDEPLLSEIVAAVDPTQTTLNQLVEQLVLSPAFRMVSTDAVALAGTGATDNPAAGN